MALDKYRYRPLRNNEIRVLKPLSNDGLSFDLVHVNLDDQPQFSALSYVWGVEVFNRSIKLGESNFPVTENLHDAFQAISSYQKRREDAISQTNHLWIDAICINQQDIPERNTQVPLMARIYRQATQVLAWLGKPEFQADVELGVQMMEGFLQGFFESQSKSKVPGSSPTTIDESFEIKQIEADQLSYLSSISDNLEQYIDVEGSKIHNAWVGIFDIWRSRFWGRAWILQEATVPENDSYWPHYAGRYGNIRIESKVAFLCGSSSTNFQALLMAAQIASLLAQRKPKVPEDVKIPVWTGFEQAYRLRMRRIEELGLDLSLLPVLQTIRNSQSTNPRDKVYAGLGIIPLSGLDGKEERVAVDYAKSVYEVYFDVPKVCLTKIGHELDFLGYTRKMREGELEPSERIGQLLPTWVPNWDEPLYITPMPKDEVFYNATRDSKVSASIEGNNLFVKGVQCDAIKTVMSPLTMDYFTQLKMELNIEYEGEELEDVFFRALCMDIQVDNYGRVVGKYNKEDFSTVEWPWNGKVDEVPLDLQQRLQWGGDGRRSLCLTERGYIGLVPASARDNDLICGFFGSKVLHVVRDDEDRHEYIGECFVDHLMDGKVMNWVENGALEVETFVLGLEINGDSDDTGGECLDGRVIANRMSEKCSPS